ncbi:hypothetical protein AHAS_Ahas12G0062500 [Arachis hypogaea]
MVVVSILSLLLMILIDIYGYTFRSRNKKHVMSLRHSRRLLKNKVAIKLKFSEQTDVQNILHVQITLSNIEFNIS